MPRTPRQVVRSALPPLPKVPKVPGLPKVPTLRPRIDPAGWTTGELTAYLASGRSPVRPPRRAGHEAVRLTNSLDGTLPVDAVLLARAVADAAPPLGHEISETLLQIVDRYLPDTLIAYCNSGSAAESPEGHRLILDQLHLLHQVTGDVLRAQAEHDDRELRVQESFLRERFARTANGLDLTPSTGAAWVSGVGPKTPIPARRTAPRTGPRGLAASTLTTHHRLVVDQRPTAVFNPDANSDGILRARLALPPGVSVVLGAVIEKHSGAVSFVNAGSKRWQARKRQRGFGTPQMDVSIALPLAEVKRFIIHARTRVRGNPADVVLFLSEGATNTAELPTTLVRRTGTTTTVLASGHDTSDGLFLRNESLIHPNLRAACDAFDYGRVTWLSSDTPAV